MPRRIRWGILSTANIAVKRFIPGVAGSCNGDVVAIAGRDLARASEVASRLNIPRAYGSYEELLADAEIDAIYNPLPNSLHARWTLAAAERGKPILCEKPLARDAAEAAHVVRECARLRVPLMEAFMYRFHPQHARVRALIDAGDVGELRAVRASFSFLLEPLAGNNVRLQRDLAGGALMDVGCYTVNAARMLFGEEPAWASAQWDVRDDLGVDVALAGVLGFSQGRMATIDCGFRAGGKSSYQVAGTRGRIDVLDAFTPDPPGDAALSITANDGSRRAEAVPAVDQYRLEAEAFAASLITGEPVPIDPRDAVANLRAIEALRDSAKAHGLRKLVA